MPKPAKLFVCRRRCKICAQVSETSPLQARCAKRASLRWESYDAWLFCLKVTERVLKGEFRKEARGMPC